jgi:hypothetical protein
MTAPEDDRAADASELRRASIHEYAHLAVARHFGACGFVTVQRIVPRPPQGDRYAGRFQMFGELTDIEWRMVALAGTLAECLDSEPAIDAEAVAARLDDGRLVLSPVDAALARGHGGEELARCLALLKELWPAIDADAIERQSRDASVRY